MKIRPIFIFLVMLVMVFAPAALAEENGTVDNSTDEPVPVLISAEDSGNDAGDNSTEVAADDEAETADGNETAEVEEETEATEGNETEADKEVEGIDVADEEDEAEAGTTNGLFMAFGRVAYNIDKFLAKNPEKRAEVAAKRYQKLEHKKRVMMEKGKFGAAQAVAEEQGDVQGDLEESVTDLEGAVEAGDADEETLAEVQENVEEVAAVTEETQERINKADKKNLKQTELASIADVLTKGKANVEKVKASKEKVVQAKAKAQEKAKGNGKKAVSTEETAEAGETEAKGNSGKAKTNGKNAVTEEEAKDGSDDAEAADDSKGKSNGKGNSKK